MARVIFCVDLTLEIRLRMDLRLGTAAYFSLAFEALFPFFDFALGAAGAPEARVLPDSAAGLDALLAQLQAARAREGLSASELARLGAVEARAAVARERIRSLRERACRIFDPVRL